MKQKPLRILLLEDIEEEAGLIERVLKKEKILFTAFRTDTKDEFIKALDSFSPDVVLSDHALPQFNSIEALQLCRQRGLMIPFILVTGMVSEEFAVSCMKQGVDDYILKSNLSRLPTAIKNSLKHREIEIQKNDTEARLQARNQELLMMNEELRKINMELDNFVYSVSHNLRAPLMSVLGLINLAKMEDRSRANVVHHKMMEKSIHNLDSTLREILDYSRNARTNLKIQPVYLHDIFYNSLEKLKYVENYDRIEKMITVEGEVQFYSDLYRLSVIFHNLLANALRYQDFRKKENYIHVHAVLSEKESRIKFKDNGIGINKDYQSNIFDMFFRATEKSAGSGLGLYIVKECVQKIKGTVQVESEENEGTVVEIILPNLFFDTRLSEFLMQP